MNSASLRVPLLLGFITVIGITKIGFSLMEAGTILSVATAVAIPGRILGWLSSAINLE